MSCSICAWYLCVSACSVGNQECRTALAPPDGRPCISASELHCCSCQSSAAARPCRTTERRGRHGGWASSELSGGVGRFILLPVKRLERLYETRETIFILLTEAWKHLSFKVLWKDRRCLLSTTKHRLPRRWAQTNCYQLQLKTFRWWWNQI